MQMDEEILDVLDHMSVLAPGERDAPAPAGVALAQTKQRLADEPVSPLERMIRSVNEMTNRRAWAAGLSFVLVIVVLFSFPAVRAAANDFLGLFRVQKFAPISISPEQLAVLEQVAESGASPGEMIMVQEPDEPQEAATLSEAASLAGFQPLTLRGQEDLMAIYVTDSASGYLVVDLEGARALVSATGADPALLPDSLDGAHIDVNVFEGVEQIWMDGTRLIQTPSPYIAYPDELDETVLGEAVLQVLGTDPETAHRIAQSIDWTTTLLMPVPADLMSYEEVTVNGVPGVLLRPLDGTPGATVLWQDNGMVYGLSADYDADRLLSLARRVR